MRIGRRLESREPRASGGYRRNAFVSGDRVTRAQSTSDTHCERCGNKLQVRHKPVSEHAHAHAVLSGCETTEYLELVTLIALIL